jgi:hypothetical protein
MYSSDYFEEPLVKTASLVKFHDLSFDKLLQLAATDTKKFEELRKMLIERVISAPGSNSNQLALLQNRLDSGVPSPAYFSCLVLSDWIDESYQKLAQQLAAANV